MDQELIRKAAEAIWKKFREQYAQGCPLPIPDRSASAAWGRLPITEKASVEGWANVALTVFYEHTRAQTRGQRVVCPDCSGQMVPCSDIYVDGKGAHEGTLRCPNCGKTQ
jgi:hypothetical protein